MHQPTSEGLFRTYSRFFVHPPTSTRTPASLRQVLSSSSRLPNLLRLVFRQVLSERSLSSAEAFFKRQQTCASCHKRMIETLFRREHACEISHKRRFETLFKLGACLCTHHKRMFAARSTWQPCALNTSACFRDGKACVFTTSACLKHSRDGMACVFITSAV